MHGGQEPNGIGPRLQVLQSDILSISEALKEELEAARRQGSSAVPAPATYSPCRPGRAMPRREGSGSAVIVPLTPKRLPRTSRQPATTTSPPDRPGVVVPLDHSRREGRSGTPAVVRQEPVVRARDGLETLDGALTGLAAQARAGRLVAQLADSLTWVLANRAVLAGEQGVDAGLLARPPAAGKRSARGTPADDRMPRWLDETERQCDSLQRRIETLAGEMTVPPPR